MTCLLNQCVNDWRPEVRAQKQTSPSMVLSLKSTFIVHVSHSLEKVFICLKNEKTIDN